MALSLQSLANSILLDSLQPMARQSAKTVEANIHMLADRMMTIAGDPRLKTVTIPAPEGTQEAAPPEEANEPEGTGEPGEPEGTEEPEGTAEPEEPEGQDEAPAVVPDVAATAENRGAALAEAAEIYEFHTVALYNLEGRLIQGIDGAPESLGGEFLELLREKDNQTTSAYTI